MTAMAKHLTIRNVPAPIMRALDRVRKKRSASLNQIVIESLGRALGVEVSGPVDNGLSALAGTWSEADLQDFEKNTASFSSVDDELWR